MSKSHIGILVGYKHSKKSKENIRNARIGIKQSEESKRKKSESLKNIGMKNEKIKSHNEI